MTLLVPPNPSMKGRNVESVLAIAVKRARKRELCDITFFHICFRRRPPFGTDDDVDDDDGGRKFPISSGSQNEKGGPRAGTFERSRMHRRRRSRFEEEEEKRRRLRFVSPRPNSLMSAGTSPRTEAELQPCSFRVVIRIIRSIDVPAIQRLCVSAFLAWSSCRCRVFLDENVVTVPIAFRVGI